MLLIVMIVLLFVFILLGMDIAWSIGLAALSYIGLTFIFAPRPVNPVLLVQQMTAGVDSFTLLSIPMFIFAGELMARSSIVQRLIDMAAAMMGHKPGGLGNVAVIANLALAGTSGSATADAAAVGTALIPEMKRRGYTTQYAAGIISASACMAPIIPPSILLILLGAIANISVGDLFLAGIVPGFLMCAALLMMNRYMAIRLNLERSPKASPAERRRMLLRGLPPLGAPLLVIITKVFGIATPTEAAGMVVLYALLLGSLVYRELSPRVIFHAAVAATLTSGAIMMTVATSQVFGSLVIMAGAGPVISQAMLAISNDPIVLLLIVNIVLLVLGTSMDPLPVMLILSPILFPLMTGLGVDPVHLGLVMVFNLVLGGVTPPVGLNLFVMSRVARIPVMQVFRGGLPFYSILFAVLLLVTYVPQLSLFIPHYLTTNH
ncbi:TRAP transporter large permease [Gemmobacter nectariphilus]|uniref:TRAP transporter large permease n=1 Tax=Gemmobacter nectariphilus TaxID=220343 RepID=UPI0004091018|nr:TRAP transporter large permease [Gemmobacter nectariphilus]